MSLSIHNPKSPIRILGESFNPKSAIRNPQSEIRNHVSELH
ncbi:MAG: Av71 muscle cell intermediate filament [Acidobacteria bacterium]|nr:MAG: Av71 muscle cell intermediate filament [Acidobacteriota bacterium]